MQGASNHTKFFTDLFSRGKKAEALSWLHGAHPGSFRNLGELDTTEESIELVEHLYSLGAAEIIAVVIDEYPEGENTGKLVIRLPDDRPARNRIFAWNGDHAESKGFDRDEDVGHEYLFVMLD